MNSVCLALPVVVRLSSLPRTTLALGEPLRAALAGGSACGSATERLEYRRDGLGGRERVDDVLRVLTIGRLHVR